MIAWPMILARLLLAIVLGGVIGVERELHEQRAGMRTNALVALGSALFTLISAYGFLDLLQLSHVQIDPTRVASYIVAGMGFLGAGAIVVHNSNARGLTTAAAIWLVAAVGMACGIGFYWEAVAATVFALIVLRVLRWLELRLLPSLARADLQIHLEAGTDVGIQTRQIYELCLKHKLVTKNIQVHTDAEEHIITYSCHFARVEEILQLVEELRTLPGVRKSDLDLHDLEQAIPRPSSKHTELPS